MERLVLVFCAACAASLGLTWAVRHAALTYARRRQSADARLQVPAIGGICLFIASFLSLGVIYFGEWGMDEVLRQRIECLLLGSAILCAVGSWNDWSPIRGRYMLIGQLAGVGAVLLSDLSIPQLRMFRTTIELGAWGKVGTAVVLLAVVNAFRMLADMEGVVACLGVVITATLGVM